MWQYILTCGVRGKPVTHLMQFYLLQWEVAKVKPLMNSNMTLTMLNLHQKTPKGATIKTQVKISERYKRDKVVSHVPIEDKIASDMQDQRSNPGHTMTLHMYNPRPMSLPNISTSYTLWFPKYSLDKAL